MTCCVPPNICLAEKDGTATCYPADCAFMVLIPPLCGPGDAKCGPCQDSATGGAGGTAGSGGSGGAAAGPMVLQVGAQTCTGTVTNAANTVQALSSCKVSLGQGEYDSHDTLVVQAADTAGDTLVAEMTLFYFAKAGTYQSTDASSYSRLATTWTQLSPAAEYQATTTSSSSTGSIKVVLDSVGGLKLDSGISYYPFSGKVDATLPNPGMTESVAISLSF